MSLLVLHEWVSAIFPDQPPHLDDSVSCEELRFRNTFTGAITLCTLRKGELELESESASTVAIVRKSVTDQANYRRVHVVEALKPNAEAIPSFLGLLRPRLEYLLSLARRKELLDVVTDLAGGEAGAGAAASAGGEGVGGGFGAGAGADPRTLVPPPGFTAEYTSILRSGAAIRADHQTRERALQYVCGLVTDQYVDWFGVQGLDRRRQLPAVMEAVGACVAPGGFEALVALFLDAAETKARVGGAGAGAGAGAGTGAAGGPPPLRG